MGILDNLLGSSHDLVNDIKANSPKILSISSRVLSGGAVLAAGWGSWKMKGELEEHNKDIEDLHEDLKAASNATEEEEIKDLIRKRYFKTGALIVKDAAPACLLLAGSWACGIGSEKQYENKIATMGAAALLLKTAYDKAKDRAIEKYGEEEAADIFYGSKEKEVVVTDQKTGKQEIKKIKEYDPYGIIASNPCAILLGDGIDSKVSGNKWCDISFLQSLERKFTYKLNADGYVLVNDIYSELGIKPASKFQHDVWSTYGWVKSQENIDNFVRKCKVENFNLSDEEMAEGMIMANKIDLGLNNFVNENYIAGIEPMVWIIPNCIGDIMPIIFPESQKTKYLE